MGKQRLPESDLRYRRVFEVAQDGILILEGATGIIVDANPSLIRSLGYESAELLGKALWQSGLFEDAAASKKAFDELAGRGYLRQEDFRLRRKDGTALEVELVGNAYDVDGERLCQCSFRDVTERRRMERALNESEQRFRALIEHASDVIGIIGFDGTIRYVSPAISEVGGFAPAEPMGRNLFDLVHDDDRADARRLIASLAGRPGEPVRFDLRFIHKDGSVRNTESVARNMVNTPGIDGIVICTRDVTERNRQKEALRASHVILEGILNSMPVRVFWKDRNLVYLGCNAAFARDAGFADPQDIVGKDDRQLVWRDQADRYRSDDRQVIDSGRPKLLVEEPQTTPAGDTITLLTSKIPLVGADGEIEGVLGTYLDITERKRAEEARRRADEHYGLLFRGMSEGVAHCRVIYQDGVAKDLVYLEVNEAFERLTGIRNPVGRRISELIPGFAAADAGLLETYDRVVRTGVPEKFEIQVRSLGKWFAMSLYRPEQGQFVAVFDDITERKQSEQALKLFRVLIDHASDAIEVVEPATMRYLDVNQKACADLGYSREELLSMTVFDVDPELRRLDPGALEKRVSETGTALIESVHRRKDGSTFPVEVSISRARLDRDYQVVSVRDISERKAQEASLARMNRALRTLSAGNSVVVHASSEIQLLQDMCRTVVTAGGYLMAWVGLVQPDPVRTVRPVAWAGNGDDYVRRLNIALADDERGSGPTGLCIRTGMPQAARNIESDAFMSPWRADAIGHGYLSSLALPLSGPGGAFGSLTIYAAEPDAFDPDELALLTEMAGDLSYGVAALRTQAAHAEAQRRLERSMEGTVNALATTVETRDPYTAGHQRRVAVIATAIAQELALDANRSRGLHLAAAIHDIGKINIPAEILSKPGKLTDIEYELIKAHAEAGYQILKDVEFPWPVAETIHQHHERLDGSGYPRGLKADQMLQEAKILAVADVVEAMSSHRPYRASLGVDAGLDEIAKGRGTLYDTAAVDACLRLFRERGFRIPD
ncbi:MAG: PAS domain S-box protein [Nevskia sp.]|nr:PAS domain S-box protein [Nevskia sp.]